MITRKEQMSNSQPSPFPRRYLTINCTPLLLRCYNHLQAPRNSNVNTVFDFDISKRGRYMKFK